MGTTIDQTTATQTRIIELDTQEGPPPPPPKLTTVATLSPSPAVAPELRMLASRSKLYVDDITPGDIRQGSLGDCTLQASLASLARTTEGRALIRSLIQPVRDASGAEVGYRVNVCRKDVLGRYAPSPQTVMLTEIKNIDIGVMGADNVNGKTEVWPRVIEKAIMKANPTGTGNVPEAFGMLTGREATDSPTSDASFESRLKLGFATSKLQTLSTTGAFLRDIYAPVHLVANHCYTVTGVFEQNGKTFVQLRNPWGYDSPCLPLDVVKKYFPTYSEGTVK